MKPRSRNGLRGFLFTQSQIFHSRVLALVVGFESFDQSKGAVLVHHGLWQEIRAYVLQVFGCSVVIGFLLV